MGHQYGNVEIVVAVVFAAVVIHRPITSPPITETTTSTAAPSTPTTISSPLCHSSPRFSASPPFPIPLGVTKESRSSSSVLSCRKAVSKKSTAYTEDVLRELYYYPLPPDHQIRKTKLKQEYPGNKKEPQTFGVTIDQIVTGPLPGYEDVIDVDDQGIVKEGRGMFCTSCLKSSEMHLPEILLRVYILPLQLLLLATATIHLPKTKSKQANNPRKLVHHNHELMPSTMTTTTTTATTTSTTTAISTTMKILLYTTTTTTSTRMMTKTLQSE
jgi:hypothetical protein